MNPDQQFMQRALELAREGVGLASPNPCVGAVVLDAEGRVAGEGTHLYEGRKHAEVLALEQAGERGRGGTLYLTLEPCCHTGRTGPCSDAVIAAGLRRVVVAMVDPNPLVAGQGLEKLRAAGIEVVTGPGEQEARKLNEAFACWIRTHRPLVTLKSAMTLDARIAPRRGDESAERWITNEAARAHVQQLRHASDAIMVGVGTVVSDDPLLTDRSGRPRRRPLLRVVLDSRLRIPLESKLVESANDDLVVFCTAHESWRRKELEKRGVRVEQIEGLGRPELKDVMERLGQANMISVTIEGGSMVNGAALEAGVVDKLFLYYAPKMLGDGALPFVTGTYVSVQATGVTLHRFGEDFAVEGYLRDPYAQESGAGV
jgi:diaminohydroxyphosphoribosylaminopyrimidine deaminase/5-amino-6-(5-phosphoribosylamino)uracil reductase